MRRAPVHTIDSCVISIHPPGLGKPPSRNGGGAFKASVADERPSPKNKSALAWMMR